MLPCGEYQKYEVMTMSVVSGQSKKKKNTQIPLIKQKKHIERTFRISDYYQFYSYCSGFLFGLIWLSYLCIGQIETSTSAFLCIHLCHPVEEGNWYSVFRWVENLPPCIKGGEFEPYFDFMLHVSLLWRIGYEAKAYTSFVLCWKYFLFVCFFLYESCFEYMNISCV